MFIKFKEIFNDEYTVFSVIVTVTSLANIISSLEWLALYNHFKDDRIFSWNVKKTSSKIFSKSKFYNYLFGYPNILLLIFCQIVISILVPFVTENRLLLCMACFAASLLSISFSVRNDSRFSGADQMNKIVFITVAICLISSSKWIWQLGLFFMSGQIIIAYCTPGYLRIFEPSWHNNIALTNILRLHTFSRPFAWEFVKSNPRVAKLISIGLIIFECSFLIAWLLPFNYLLLFLGFGVVFHIFNAIIMGLNNFTGSFIATYPSYIWFSTYLRHILKVE